MEGEILTQRRDYICKQPRIVNSIMAEHIGKWCVKVAENSDFSVEWARRAI
ncbi:MAG: hypothetical protein DDT32_01956 [Syntrophomonadaceae bacterium]|nr:hypothetical protein [Bacillota bacterium]